MKPPSFVIAKTLLGLAAALFLLGKIEQVASASDLAATPTQDIQSLAYGLGHDPKRIYDYVHDHIQYVCYFGSKKGAQLTLLERSGNDFDQCALLVALLRCAGFAPTYEFQVLTMPCVSSDHRDWQHWLGLISSNPGNTPYIALGFVNNGQFPIFDWDSANNLSIHRVWVKLTVGGVTYHLDPAFKVSERVAGINLGTAMGLNTNALLNAAAGIATADYVQNLNETAVRDLLSSYTVNLLNTIRSNCPNATAAQVLGGQTIVSSENIPLSTQPPFPADTIYSYLPLQEWAAIPTNFLATLEVALPNTNVIFYLPALNGDRLSLTFDAHGLAELWEEDTRILSCQTAGDGNFIAVTNTLQLPTGSWDNNRNALVPYGPWPNYAFYRNTNSSYALFYAFNPHHYWLDRRQQKLEQYRSQFPGDSRQVVSETLNVMALSWLVQSENALRMLGAENGQVSGNQYRGGRFCQEIGAGYYIDGFMDSCGLNEAAGFQGTRNAKLQTSFYTSIFFGSAFEHGIIEQTQPGQLQGASTVKMLELANRNGSKVFLANSRNWTFGANVSSQLVNYPSLVPMEDCVYSGGNVLLPENGDQSLGPDGSWNGYGYAFIGSSGWGMIISGGYYGGQSGSASSMVDSKGANQSHSSDQHAYDPVSSVTGGDPVNMADGAFHVSSVDLSIGAAEPRGLSFIRQYNSRRRYAATPGLPNGWLHNYCGKVAAFSSPLADIDTATPAQLAPMIVATYAASKIYPASPSPKPWMLTALISKWGIDQLINNSVSVGLGKDILQFTRQPDGTFSPPPNSTAVLTNNGVTYSLLERNARAFNFDTNSHLSSIVDQYGATTRFDYNAANLLSAVTDWKGRSLAFYYQSNSPGQYQLQTISDSTGRSVSFGYSSPGADGDLVCVTDPEGKVQQFTYDAQHQITAVIDPLNRIVISNLYDAFGRVSQQYVAGDTNRLWRFYWSGYCNGEQDPSGAQRVFYFDDWSRSLGTRDALGNRDWLFYDGQNQVTMTVSTLNETNLYRFDANHNLVAAVDPLGFTATLAYDSFNRLTNSSDRLGHSTQYQYNARHQITQVVDPLQNTVRFGYSPTDGTLLSQTDQDQNQTLYAYDAYGQLNRITYPGGASESFQNDARGDVLGHQDANGNHTGYTYNLRHQRTSVVRPDNVTTRFSYDAAGNLEAITDGRGFTTSKTWSVTKELLNLTLPPTPAGIAVLSNTYDARDYLVRTTDPLGFSTSYEFDPTGRRISVTDPLFRKAHVGFDADSRQIAVTNANYEISRWNYDARSRIAGFVTPLNKAIGCAYDAAGNQIAITNRQGGVWQFAYDANNRSVTNISPTSRVSSRTFNNLGLLASSVQPSGKQTIYSYDARQRLMARTDPVGTVVYGYDDNNNLTSVAEAGKTNAFTFDTNNRVQTYRDADGNLMQYAYDANNNLTTLVYPGGRTVLYAYNSHNRLTNVTDWAQRKTSFLYDLADRLIQITRPNGTVRQIAYDNAGQTTQIIEKEANRYVINMFQLNWNIAGRVESEFAAPLPHVFSPPAHSATYDLDNRLLTFNGQAVTHDPDGNMLNGPLPSGTQENYTFDARNRLINAGGVTYGYDAMNNRTSATDAGGATQYVVNPNAALSQVLIRRRNGVSTYYVYGIGLLYEETGGSTATYHYDYRGSTVALTDDSSQITDRMEYSAYGTQTYHAGTNTTESSFAGRHGLLTDCNGLVYMRARYYNSYLSRFVNQDPTGFGGGMNFFAYANNNPIILNDPLGLCSESSQEAYDDRNAQNNAAQNALNQEQVYNNWITALLYGTTFVKDTALVALKARSADYSGAVSGVVGAGGDLAAIYDADHGSHNAVPFKAVANIIGAYGDIASRNVFSSASHVSETASELVEAGDGPEWVKNTLSTVARVSESAAAVKELTSGDLNKLEGDLKRLAVVSKSATVGTTWWDVKSIWQQMWNSHSLMP